jgi:hypothetical protein
MFVCARMYIYIYMYVYIYEYVYVLEISRISEYAYAVLRCVWNILYVCMQ